MSKDMPPALELAAEVVTAYAGKNKLNASELPVLLQSVHDAYVSLMQGASAMAGNQPPAVPIKKSITPSHIICLEDGKKMKMLKRYLRTQYDISPEEYRRKWGLPADYPMTAPSYSKRRSNLAKDIGLGHGPTSRNTKRKSKKRR